jgi:hypothetical protein
MSDHDAPQGADDTDAFIDVVTHKFKLLRVPSEVIVNGLRHDAGYYRVTVEYVTGINGWKNDEPPF